MKDSIQFIAIAVIAFCLYQVSNEIARIVGTLQDIKALRKADSIEINLIAQRLDVRDRERKEMEKIAKNQELLGDISCGACHNSSLSLPIHNISLNEAIQIVRNGSPRSIAGGMPKYKNINTGKDEPFISDSGLRNRLKDLYTEDFLKIAIDKEKGK